MIVFDPLVARKLPHSRRHPERQNGQLPHDRDRDDENRGEACHYVRLRRHRHQRAVIRNINGHQQEQVESDNVEGVADDERETRPCEGRSVRRQARGGSRTTGERPFQRRCCPNRLAPSADWRIGRALALKRGLVQPKSSSRPAA